MEKYYVNKFDDNLAVSTLGGEDQSERIENGKKGFKPYVCSSRP